MNQRVKNWISLIVFVLLALWVYKQFGSRLFEQEPDRSTAAGDDHVDLIICKHNPISVVCHCTDRETGMKANLSYQECVQIAESQRNR